MGSFLACCRLPRGSQQLENDQPMGMAEGSSGGGNKPLQRHLKWTAEKPMTEGELLSKREVFWDTAPKYDGRQEIWLAIKAALECEDDQTAQAIIDSAMITIPTGILSAGAYDELGNRYVIPDYCVCPPTNFVRNSPGDSIVDADASSAVQSPSSQAETTARARGQLVNVLLRLSSNKDIPMNDLRGSDRIADLKSRLIETERSLKQQEGNLSIRVMCMGRMLGDQQSVEDALKIMGGSDSSGASSFKTTKQRPLVLQVMITGA